MCPHIFIATEQSHQSRHFSDTGGNPKSQQSAVAQMLSDGILSLLVGGSQWPVDTFEGLDLFQGSEK